MPEEVFTPIANSPDRLCPCGKPALIHSYYTESFDDFLHNRYCQINRTSDLCEDHAPYEFVAKLRRLVDLDINAIIIDGALRYHVPSLDRKITAAARRG